MSWHAIDALWETYETTKGFLLTFDAGLWLRLTAVVFFVGGSYTSLPTNTGGVSGASGGDVPVDELADGIPDEINVEAEEVVSAVAELLTPAAVAVLVGVLALVLAYTYLSAVFRFVLYRSVRDEEVRIRAWAAEYAYDGLKLFLFGLAKTAVLIAGVAAGVASLFGYGPLPPLALPLLIPLWLLLWLLSFFVVSLAVPEMVVEGVGFVGSVRRAYGYVRAEPKQAVVFLLTGVALGIVASVVLGAALVAAYLALALALVLAVIFLGIPLAIVGVSGESLTLLFLSAGAVAALLTLVVVWAAVTVPAQTYVHRWVLGVRRRFAA